MGDLLSLLNKVADRLPEPVCAFIMCFKPIWPLMKMKIYPHLIVCLQCDSVYRYRPYTPGKTAICERCQAVLWQGDGRGIYRILPLTVAATVAFSVACISPVMRVDFHGVTNDVTLWQTAWGLSSGEPFPLLAFCTVFLLVAAPALQLTLLAWLLLFARYLRPAPGFITLMKLLLWLRPWSMIEVGMLGFVVAAVKLSSLLDVSPGPGGWALGTAGILILIVTRYDLHPLWELLTVRQGDHDEE